MADRPNILFLFSDQHRPEALGCAAESVAHTPALDRLAERGVRFEECYTTSPLCGPARASLISGVYPVNTYIIENGGRLPADDETLFHNLQEAGYYTGHIGDSDYAGPATDHIQENEPYMHERGFDYVHETPGAWGSANMESYMSDHWKEVGLWDTFREDYERRMEESGLWPSPLPFEEHMDSYIGRQAVEFLEEYDREQPFCLQVGFNGPHDPMDPPERLLEHYDPGAMPDPVPPMEVGSWVPDRARQFLEQGGLTGPAQGWWRQCPTPEQAREWRTYYYAKVTLIDHWIGEILDALEARGELQNTVVVYASDHGEMAGDQDLFTKHVFFDASVRVPCIVAGPAGDLKAGETSDALVELIDLYPTFLDVADAGEGRTFGESLLGLLENPDREHREAVFSMVHGFADTDPPYDYKTMVATEEYKYCIDSWGDGYMLFDREADPDEQRNLVGHPDYADVERDLRDRLLSFFQRTTTQYSRYEDRDVIQKPKELPGDTDAR